MLAQEFYKDENGNDIDANDVQSLAAYEVIADGFYNWECGPCGNIHSSRSCGWPISGQVLKCDTCGTMNLLVRTNCIQIDKALYGEWQSVEDAKELASLRGIRCRNMDEINSIKADIARKVTECVRQWSGI